MSYHSYYILCKLLNSFVQEKRHGLGKSQDENGFQDQAATFNFTSN